ncbi:hypothetical protein LTR62_006060 [Meristemomyces frigidus]|uniref:26S proteasome complex subunit SEM1 n=1 Tax=Meristemomyces frigidus TaxID=1508187 RepID=A0AAN7YEV5_9PEZI|nr:hypothetical protein LTR62_006060 [Meristemomyces frigidus]
MSGATASSAPTTKLQDPTDSSKSQSAQPQKPAAQLEEDDEFEDFPVEDWTKEEEVSAQQANTHLWEESWDDDDTNDEFSVQLKEELKKMEGQRKG